MLDSVAKLKGQMKDSGTSIASEFTGGLATFLTLSYVFLLNPVLLARTGMPIEAAFFGTIVAAALSTLIMGWYAKAPFAVAPAPSITTFFVGYVCVDLGLSWQSALGAVVISGVVSMALAQIGAKAGLIRSLPEGLKYGVIFALSGFLIASGLRQAGIIKVEGDFIALDKVSDLLSLITYPGFFVLVSGLAITVVLNAKPFDFRGAPIFGILIATAIAFSFGITANVPDINIDNAFVAFGAASFSDIFSGSMFISILLLFVIDFFGGVGKFVGLERLLKSEGVNVSQDKIDKALMVDGVGNVVGGFVGASSLAVFVSSAVGIKSGARTGLSAIFCAFFMLLCLLLIPLVGAIPSEATSGVLIFIGCLLLPWKLIWSALAGDANDELGRLDVLIGASAAALSFFTFSIDTSLLLIFFAYSVVSLAHKKFVENVVLYAVTLLLGLAVILQ